ncbi:Nif3-like dinuclear metal center hexameric protein [Flavitalea flava]
MQISAVLSHLESIAPPAYQESYDNAGLLTGSGSWECTGILVTLDATEAVIKEAIARHCNLVVAHHPIIFGGLKKITGRNYVEKTVITAIKNDIAIFAIHTNLDHTFPIGVNGRMAERLGLVNTRPLSSREAILQKLVCYVPATHLEAVRNALFGAGAGQIGNYSECSFSAEGTGTFRGDDQTHPFAGEPGLRHHEKEVRVEVILPSFKSRGVVAEMLKAHPYEEVAYDLINLANSHPRVGAGLIGELSEETGEEAFLAIIRESFRVPVIRHTRLNGRPVKKVALCGGAGSFLISNALAAEADFYITSDVKYHEFFDANDRLVIADIGHYESEQFTVDLLFDLLHEKFPGHLREKSPTFAILKSETITNPVNYFGSAEGASAEGP